MHAWSIHDFVETIINFRFYFLSREALLSVSTNFLEEVDLGKEGIKVKLLSSFEVWIWLDHAYACFQCPAENFHAVKLMYSE